MISPSEDHVVGGSGSEFANKDKSIRLGYEFGKQNVGKFSCKAAQKAKDQDDISADIQVWSAGLRAVISHNLTFLENASSDSIEQLCREPLQPCFPRCLDIVVV